MGEIAEGLIDGTFDSISGEYLGPGPGYPRTRYTPRERKSEDFSWKKVTGYMNTKGIKAHLHPDILKHYGVVYSGRHPLRNACFEVLKDFPRFKIFIDNYLNTKDENNNKIGN